MGNLSGITGPIGWPYKEPKTLGDDAVGDTVLREHDDGTLWWYAYEWEEYWPKRAATDAEVIDALLAHVREQDADRRREEPYARLGRAVAAVLPDALAKATP
jgi:hypothetical protein